MKLIKKIRLYLEIRFERLQILLQLVRGKSKRQEKDKVVVVDIYKQSNFNRNFVNPIQFLLRYEYVIYFRFRINLIRLLCFTYRIISKNKNVKIIFSRPKGRHIYLTNSPTKFDDMCLKGDKFGLEEYEKNSHRIPFSMHPFIYKSKIYNQKESSDISYGNRKFNIVFAGNLDKSSYYNYQWGDDYYVNRVELVKKIKQEYYRDIFEPKKLSELESSFQADICFVDRKYFSLEIDEYFTFLKSGNFAFCPPGMNYPMCHNLIEAMYCGTVPITKYDKLLDPRLKDGINCIHYSNPDDLINAIEKALSMNSKQIEKMSKNVTDYYDNYLHPDAVVKNFEKAVSSGVKAIYLPVGW